MENKENISCEEGSEYDDSLSFCNYSMQDNKESSVMQSPRNSSAEEFFEFFGTEMSLSSNSNPDIIFCGKIVRKDQDELKEYQKRDYLATVRSKTFRSRPSSYGEYPFLINEEKDVSVSHDRSSPLRTMSSRSSKYSANNQIQSVNITSLTSMSAKSRRRMFMFGPVKFKPEMELSAIKERQGRRVPTIIFPAPEDVEKTVAGGGNGKSSGKSNRGWIMRSLRRRSYIAVVLGKSFGCISPGAVTEKWIGCAN